MIWLYTHYIKPYLDEVPQGDYDIYFFEMFEAMSFQCERLYDKTQEFLLVHAFLLGLRTGRGLPRD
jgi:hypothetical protein